MRELAMRKEMEERKVCTEKEKAECYEDEIEMEKIRDCQRALEREKIARGIVPSKEVERQLKEIQRLQIEDKKSMERHDQEVEAFWHHVLMDDYYRKEHEERVAEEKRKQEMMERRMCYDEQIASANRKRQEALRIEREKENRRLEKIRVKMEQDHLGAVKRKKEQQMMNKKNFIEGHEAKLARLQDEKRRAREIDNGTIRVALENLRIDEERNMIQMKSLQKEKFLCLENYKKERKMDSALEEEANTIADEWRREAQEKTDSYLREVDLKKSIDKQRASDEYRRYIEKRKQENARALEERRERMKRVNLTALNEIERKISNTEKAIQRQTDYRNALSSQIRNNQKYLERDIAETENKDRPFTDKAVFFKDAMNKRHQASSGRTSTNPVHPFRRLMESKEGIGTIHLPSIR